MPEVQVCPFCNAPANPGGGKRLTCAACHRPLAGASQKMAAAGSVKPAGPVRQGVSRAYRKMCSVCGADVTFGARRKLEDGTYRCETCDRDNDDAPTDGEFDLAPLPTVPKIAKNVVRASSDHGDDVFGDPEEETLVPPFDPTEGPAAPTDTNSAKRWILLGIGAAVLAIGISTCIILIPRWDESHLNQIISMRQAATQLYGANKPVESYHAFQALFAFVGDHPVKNSYAVAELDGARATMQQAYAKAKPIIDKEEADAKAQQEALEAAARQAAAEQAAQQEKEQQERAAAELAAQEQAKEERARVELAAKQAVVRAIFLRSSEHAALESKAQSIVSRLQTSMIGEDSAYRTISERAKATRELFAVMVKLQGRLCGSNVDEKVDQITASVDTDLIGEDSAIRATYVNDRASLKLLGVWCALLSSDFPKLSAGFDKVQADVDRDVAGEDSAIRDIDAYSSALMGALRLIAASLCGPQGPDAVMSDVSIAQIGEDSAWRSAMKNCDGSMKLLLLLLDHDGDTEQAKSIRNEAFSAAVDDDSALRVQSQYRQGMVDAIAGLIANR